jgi:hypothetical protein
MPSRVEIAVMAVSAVIAAEVFWLPAVCLFRRVLRRRRSRQVEPVAPSLLDVIGRR